MKNIRIEDLSAIQQRKIQEQSLEEGRSHLQNSRIVCPINQKQNYQCEICNRLRKVCPYGKNSQCKHNQQFLKVRPDVSWQSKANQSSFFNDRLKTFSTIQSRNQSRNQSSNVYISPSRHNQSQNNLNSSQQVIVTEKSVPQTQEIIFFPVIHNKLIATPSRNPVQTPPRVKKNERFEEIREEMILTPTQFKGLMESYRN